MTSNAQHLTYLRQALDLARNSPPKPTNFRVGCVLVGGSNIILSTGYTLELAGNTHAEQCAISKLTTPTSVPESDISETLTPEMNTTLYTTMEPCGKRLSGNTPCVQRIIATRSEGGGGIRKVVFGAKEPGTFVKDSESCRMMTEAGVEWEYIPGMENEILEVAKEGHKQDTETQKQETNIDDITSEERKRQEAMPRNPKKRMMEVDINR